MKIKYEAFDGRLFDTENDCLNYEETVQTLFEEYKERVSLQAEEWDKIITKIVDIKPDFKFFLHFEKGRRFFYRGFRVESAPIWFRSIENPNFYCCFRLMTIFKDTKGDIALVVCRPDEYSKAWECQRELMYFLNGDEIRTNSRRRSYSIDEFVSLWQKEYINEYQNEFDKDKIPELY